MQNKDEKVRKLVLSKETLRMLSGEDLEAAKGANRTYVTFPTVTASELWGGCTSKWTATCVDPHDPPTYTTGCE